MHPIGVEVNGLWRRWKTWWVIYTLPCSRIEFLTLSLKLSNDPTLSSLPLLTTFLKYFSRPYMGLTPLSTKQISAGSEPGTLSSVTENAASTIAPHIFDEKQELIEKDIRDRFKRMCDGYFESVSKKLLVEHHVSLLSLGAFTLYLLFHSAFKIKTGVITKHTFVQGRFLKIGSKLTKRWPRAMKSFFPIARRMVFFLYHPPHH